MNNQNPSVIVKRRNIQSVIDYCLDQKIECKMSPRDISDDWELVFSVADIMKAINLGMFLKENKLELIGLLSSATIKNSTAPSAVKARKRKSKKDADVVAPSVNEKSTSNNDMFDSSEINTHNIFNSSPTSATIADDGVEDDELPL